jgi:hypothetical protein
MSDYTIVSLSVSLSAVIIPFETPLPVIELIAFLIARMMLWFALVSNVIIDGFTISDMVQQSI